MTPRVAQLRGLVLGDEPQSWQRLGFHVGGPDDDHVQLANTSILLTASGSGFEGWAIEGVEGPLDGLAVTTREVAIQDPETAHPNGISCIDHIVVRTGNIGRSTDALAEVGIEARRGRSTTSYGAPMRQVFFWLGDVILELVGPDDGEPTTDEATSVIGLALTAADLDATTDHMGALAGAPKDAVQSGRRIAGIRGGEVGVSLPLAVMSPHRAG